MMDPKAALAERRELFDNVYEFKHNKRVPIHSGIWTWKVLDAGYKLSEAIYNYDLMEKIVDEFHERYQFDAYSDLGTRNPMKFSEALGNSFHYIDASDEAVLIDDFSLMERGEYGELAADSDAFYWTRALKRACKPGITLREFKAACLELETFQKFSRKMSEKLYSEYGAFRLSGLMIRLPFEDLFNTLRGIKESAMDLRKCKSEMKETMDTLFYNERVPLIDSAVKRPFPKAIAAIGTTFLGHSILSVKQFEELYWPYLKYMLDAAIANQQKMYIMCESTMIRFAEFFQDVPKGVLMILLEQDDIFEMRKRLPNVALAGGMKTSLLGYGTKEQCVDYAKTLIDTLGEGFVLSQDKMISYRNDVRRENLLAVNEFARNYQY
jgi:hypothetical protein